MSIRDDIEKAMQMIRDNDRYDVCPVNGQRHMISPAAKAAGHGVCGCGEVIGEKP